MFVHYTFASCLAKLVNDRSQNAIKSQIFLAVPLVSLPKPYTCNILLVSGNVRSQKIHFCTLIFMKVFFHKVFSVIDIYADSIFVFSVRVVGSIPKTAVYAGIKSDIYDGLCLRII
ncbi:hypothetical protein [Nostoc sp. KVJ20]|uniref:hypothetical protein n=2 Tax=unclassified Nostoc TaxID=2593658 RepID=UPI00159F0A59|nr:hypothetical protein [Nostoc sp. KVJ20]